MAGGSHVHNFRDSQKKKHNKEFKVRISKVWLTAYNTLGLFAA